MSFYVYETQTIPNESARTCIKCGWGMDEGFLHEPSGSTYCSVACLDNDISLAQQEEMTLDDLFWTDWHNEVEVAE
ncbi:hypothetical protein MKY15_20780 [Sporosarcina sp. FSL K6-1540]|uniref:hypothetical protein n=1 Tax=Sporosarcina sp. FSL K6-1540 TaxID=2921555 RepID=UPI00315A503D